MGCLAFSFIIMMHATSCSGTANASASGSDSSIRKAIVEDNWVFTANFVNPQGARSRATNGIYTVSLQSGKLIVALPYFGRAWGGGVLNSQGPLDFKSENPVMKKDNIGRGKWIIEIKPKDYPEVQSMNFTFYESGSANLNVTLSSRSGISFNGNLEPGKIPGNN